MFGGRRDRDEAMSKQPPQQPPPPCGAVCSSSSSASSSSSSAATARKRSEFLSMIKSVCLNSASGKNNAGKGRSKLSSNKWAHGYHLVKGQSGHDMEDYHVAEHRYEKGHELGLYAIYDGHLGDSVPTYLKEHLFTNILRETDFWRDPEGAIRNAYRTTDKLILENSTRLGPGGSTAVTAIVIDGRDLWIANVGDSRAVVCERGAANQLSVDHEPDMERKRIEKFSLTVFFLLLVGWHDESCGEGGGSAGRGELVEWGSFLLQGVTAQSRVLCGLSPVMVGEGLEMGKRGERRSWEKRSSTAQAPSSPFRSLLPPPSSPPPFPAALCSPSCSLRPSSSFDCSYSCPARLLLSRRPLSCRRLL